MLLAASGWCTPLQFAYYGEFGTQGRGRDQLERPLGIAYSGQDVIAVSDWDRETLVFYDKRGNWLNTVGKPRGEGSVAFDRPGKVVADSTGRFWVVDTGNERLVAVNRAGMVLLSVGKEGFRPGEFRNPSDVTIGPGGDLFVADTGNSRVQRFDSKGKHLDTWREKLSLDERSPIRKPISLAYSDDGRGHIWVVNEGSPLLRKLDLDGREVSSLNVAALVEGLTEVTSVRCDSSFDRLFLLDAPGRRVVVVSSVGKLLTIFSLPDDAQPGGLEFNWSLDIFVTDIRHKRVLVYKRH